MAGKLTRQKASTLVQPVVSSSTERAAASQLVGLMTTTTTCAPATYVSPLVKAVQKIVQQLDNGDVRPAQTALTALLNMFDVKDHKDEQALKAGSKYGAET